MLDVYIHCLHWFPTLHAPPTTLYYGILETYLSFMIVSVWLWRYCKHLNKTWSFVVTTNYQYLKNLVLWIASSQMYSEVNHSNTIQAVHIYWHSYVPSDSNELNNEPHQRGNKTYSHSFVDSACYIVFRLSPVFR